MNSKRHPLFSFPCMAFPTVVVLWLAPAWADSSWERLPTDEEIQHAWAKKKAEFDESWPVRTGKWTVENYRFIKYHCPALAKRDQVEASGVLMLWDDIENVPEGGPPAENTYALSSLSFDEDDGWKVSLYVRSFKTAEERARTVERIFAPNPPTMGAAHGTSRTRGRVERKGVAYARGFAGTAPTEELTIELDIAEKSEFTQGDDFHVVAKVLQAGKPVAGAHVDLKARSPAPGWFGRGGRGREYGPEQSLETDGRGRVEWRTFFTVCASTGTWQLEAKANTDTAQGTISRSFEVVELKVSSDHVKENIKTIGKEWLASPDIPNGVDQEFIAKLLPVPPRGVQVNFAAYKDKRFADYACTEYTHKTLKFLNEIRFSQIKERRLLMGGVDYGPVSDNSLPLSVHSAVALYKRGEKSLSGDVLEPWFNQKKEVWSGVQWNAVFGAPAGAVGMVNHAVQSLSNPYGGQYPTSGSDGGYYPYSTAPDLLVDNVGKKGRQTMVLTYSPVVVMLVDSQGRRAGRLPDGSVIHEIPEAGLAYANKEDGTYVNLISVPDGDYQVQITGTGDGTFHLVTATEGTILNYGEQPIRRGEQATLALRSDHLNQPLTLPDGTHVPTRPGFHRAGEKGAIEPGAGPSVSGPGLTPDAKLPAEIVRITNRLDARPRSVGLRAVAADQPTALAAGMDIPVGVVVTQVTPNTAAAAAGLRVGDLILKMGGREIDDIEDFRAMLHTAEPNSRQSVALMRGQQRGSLELQITLGDSRSPALNSYTAPKGRYQFDYFPGWKLDPTPRREEVTGRIYDYLESTHDDYRVFLYADFEDAADAVASLEAFRQEASERFLHGKSGRLLLGDIPAAFASGVVGRERLFTLYRLSFVVDTRRYEMNLFTPPSNDPAKLPFVMETILGTLRRPEPTRPAEARPTLRPPSKRAPMPSVSEIEQLRKKAVEVWSPPMDVGDGEDIQFPAEDPEPAPAGWAKSEYDPTELVDLFRPLRLKKGYVLRAYIFRENGNANGVVWAVPEDAEFPEPADSPTLEHHLFKAPKPWDALDDLMEAIEGDGSEWSYLAASVLRRELREFGASWHGIDWGTHCILEDDPWKKPPAEDDFPPSRPTTPARDWKWSAARPQQWAPTVRIEPDRVTVTFYTFTGKAPERIFRHTETYRPGRYRAKVQDQLIGQGKGGFVF